VTNEDLEEMLKKLKQCDGNDEIIKAVCGDENTEVGGWVGGWVGGLGEDL
jgi:hypothetical protein